MVGHVKERQERVTMHFVVAHLVSKHCMLQNIMSTHFLHCCYPEQEPCLKLAFCGYSKQIEICKNCVFTVYFWKLERKKLSHNNIITKGYRCHTAK